MGVFSSLQPHNIRGKRAISNPEEAVNHPAYALLFDPQTAGGLIGSIAPARADECVDKLRQLGYDQTTIIGQVNERVEDRKTFLQCLV